MKMKEPLLGTVVELFSSAYANDKEVVGGVAMGVSARDLCNLTINTEAAAKYLNDELEITASVLVDYIKAAGEAVDIERSVKDDINCKRHVCRRRNRFLIPTLSLRLKHHDVFPSPKTVSVTHAKPSVFPSPAALLFLAHRKSATKAN
jgi:hypothetical protein